MQNGQMLFGSSITGCKQAWEIDEVASALVDSGKVKMFIAVVVWNSDPTRHFVVCFWLSIDYDFKNFRRRNEFLMA